MLIYKATFPNGKSYIGRTTRSLNKRKQYHKKDSKTKKRVICNAIRKYGWENVLWEILEDNITDFEYLKERETFNILKYDTYIPNGYNMILEDKSNGSFGYSFTKEYCSLLQKGKRKGHPLSESVKKEISNRRKGKKFIWIKNYKIDNTSEWKQIPIL